MLEEEILYFNNILSVVSKIPEPEKKLIQEAQTICKLLAVSPVTSTAGKPLFSSAWYLKMWLRSRMGDVRFSNPAIWIATSREQKVSV